MTREEALKWADTWGRPFANTQSGDAAALYILATIVTEERELLRQARGWLEQWRKQLDHSGFQNATYIMTLEGVTAMIGRIDAANASSTASDGSTKAQAE